MQKQINPVILVAAAVILLGLIIGGIVYFTQPRPPAGVSYTPGAPPESARTGASGYNPRAPVPGAR